MLPYIDTGGRTSILKVHLYLETTRLSATTSTLELAMAHNRSVHNGHGRIMRRTFRPLEAVYGFLCLWGPWPKCLTASREFFLPRSKIVFEPVGARSASWSSVKTSPPALRMRSFALRVKRRAHTLSFGISWKRTSSVIVPITTIVFDSEPGVVEVSLTILERETGGRWILDWKSRFRMT